MEGSTRAEAGEDFYDYSLLAPFVRLVSWRVIERELKAQDRRMKVTLPKLKFMEDER